MKKNITKIFLFSTCKMCERISEAGLFQENTGFVVDIFRITGGMHGRFL
ncbi:MAG: hypothetical protein WA816_03405 [Bacteroidales bacterium]